MLTASWVSRIPLVHVHNCRFGNCVIESPAMKFPCGFQLCRSAGIRLPGSGPSPGQMFGIR